jgi:PDDEXK-like domain of unknown function (DUF3799)
VSKLKIGLNNVSNAEYHADTDYLSSSVLKTILKSLEDYKDQYIDGNKKVFSNRGALDVGSLVHSLILEPELVSDSYNFFEGFRKQGEAFDNFVSSIPVNKKDLPIISTPQLGEANQLVAAYRNSKSAIRLMKNVKTEFTVCAELSDVKVKTRFDAVDLEAGLILDVKTTGYSGDHESFKQTMKDLNYPLSGALYCEVASKHFGKPFKFIYIVLSKRDKTCNVYYTSEQTHNEGLRQVYQALNKYKIAKSTNNWTEPKSFAKIESNDLILEV